MNTATALQRNDMTMQQAANELNVCRNGLFAFLRAQNVLGDGCRGSVRNLPFDTYTRRRYFHVDFIPQPPFNKARPQTRVTPEGLSFIQSLLAANPEAADDIDRSKKRIKKPNAPQNRAPANDH